MPTDVYPCLKPLSKRIKCRLNVMIGVTCLWLPSYLLVVLQAAAFLRLNQFQGSVPGHGQFLGGLYYWLGDGQTLCLFSNLCGNLSLGLRSTAPSAEFHPPLHIHPRQQILVLLLWLSLLHRKALCRQVYALLSLWAFILYNTVKTF